MHVTDTHPLIWYGTEDFSKLSKKVRALFDDVFLAKKAGLYIPSTVFLEISMLVQVNKLKLGVSFDDFVHRVLSAAVVVELPVTSETIIRSHSVLPSHKDPFDKLIVAASLEQDVPLITKDDVIATQKPCEIFWD